MECAVMPPSKRQKVTMRSIDCKNEPIVGLSKGIEKRSDWRDDAAKYRLRFKHAMESGFLTDVKFTVGLERTPFAAHKMFLAISSPVFEAMFFGSLNETNEIIHIPDITPLGFKALLEFVYTDAAIFTSEVDVFSTLLAAEKYCMPLMKDACFEYLLTCTLNDSNVWRILEKALVLNCQPLVDKCKGYLQENICAAFTSSSFLEVSKDVIEFIVMLDLLSIDEIELLYSIVKWAKEKVKNGNEETLQQLLQPFMKYIRFGCITQRELASFIDEHKNVIADKDIIELFKYNTDSEFYRLPDWCSTNLFTRKTNDLYDNLQRENFRLYNFMHNHPPNGYLETQNIAYGSQRPVEYNSDSDQSDTEYLYYPFNDRRSVNACSPISPSVSSTTSFSDTSYGTILVSDESN